MAIHTIKELNLDEPVSLLLPHINSFSDIRKLDKLLKGVFNIKHEKAVYENKEIPNPEPRPSVHADSTGRSGVRYSDYNPWDRQDYYDWEPTITVKTQIKPETYLLIFDRSLLEQHLSEQSKENQGL